MQSPILLVEDDLVDRLWPLAVAEPAFDVTCGGWTLRQHITQWMQPSPLGSAVRDYLRPAADADFPTGWHNEQAERSGWLLVNARCVPTTALIDLLRELDRQRQAIGMLAGDECIAAYLPAGTAVPDRRSMSALADWVRQTVSVQEVDAPEEWLLRYPHDVLRLHPTLMPAQMQHRIARGSLSEKRQGVHVSRAVSWQEPIATDCTAGPVIVEEGAVIMPFVYLRGPVWIGPFARVQAHATVKDSTVLGHHTRVGGEVTGTIIEPYSNKQHEGFLGHSYLGSWINLGAGTSNSDLKNSYGTVRIQVGEQQLDTGMQLLGCLVGSYAKTAIHARIMTGKMIGVNSIVYGTVSKNVPDFVNYVSAADEMTAVDLAAALSMQARMFARRDILQHEHHRQLLRAIYHRSMPQRVGLRQGSPRLL